MKKNISRFTQLDETILLEYIINNDYQNYDSDTHDVDMFSLSNNQTQILFTTPISNIDSGLSIIDNNDENTNNGFKHFVVPMENTGNEWFLYKDDKNNINDYLVLKNYEDIINKKTDIYNSNFNIAYDTVRLHIISGYTFENIFGIFLKISTLNDNGENVNLANWLYKNNDREYIYETPIIINNKVFDKYIEFKIPSVQFIRGIKYDETSQDDVMKFKRDLLLNESNLTNIGITYSTISKDNVEYVYDEGLNQKKEKGVKFTLDGNLYLQIPYNSQADNFNLFLEEASDGDYFNFYTTWCNYPLNSDIVSLFNTKIKLYETKKINELYDSIYQEEDESSSWIVVHELVTSFFNENGERVLMDEKYSITQEFDNKLIEKNVFKYKPIISDNVNANLIKHIFINYTAKLINRVDGVQIVRHGSLSTNNIKRYVTTLSRLNTKNFNNYSVYNKIIEEKISLNNTNKPIIKNKYVKVFYNVTDVILSNVNGEKVENNLLYLHNYSSTYKFVFKIRKEDGSEDYFNLNDLSTYILVYKDESDKENRINCTYSNNMNLSKGELEFNITRKHIEGLYNSPYDYFNIVVVNADGSESSLHEFKYIFE